MSTPIFQRWVRLPEGQEHNMVSENIPRFNSHPERQILIRTVKRSFPVLLIVLLFATQPAMAQEQSAICSATKLTNIIKGFFQLSTALGIIGLAVVWQADSLVEMFTLNPEQKKGIKRHKRSAVKSATVLVVLGPVYTVAGSIMGLPLANCINLVPW